MRFSILLPVLATSSFAAPIPTPAEAGTPGIALLGFCITGGKHCHNGDGLFTSLFGSGPGAAEAAAALAKTPNKRAEQAEELAIGGLLGNLPIVSSLFGTGEKPGTETNGMGGGGSGGGLGGGLGLKERGEEAGITDLLGNLPILGSIFGGGKPKNSPSPSSAMGMGRGSGSSSGLGGLGLKERGEEAGITDLLGNLPILGSIFGGGKPKNSPSPSSMGASALGMSPGMGSGMGSGRSGHTGGSIGI